MLLVNKKSIEDLDEDVYRVAGEQAQRLLDNIDSLTPQQRDELKEMLAAAGIAGSALKVSQVPQQAGASIDKMREETLKRIRDADAAGTLVKNPPPTIDPQKLAVAAERLKKLIEQDNAGLDERLEALEEAGKKLRSASDMLLKSAAQMEAELREKAQKDADWRKQGCPVAKPVTVGKPLKLRKPAP